MRKKNWEIERRKEEEEIKRRKGRGGKRIRLRVGARKK